MHPGANASTFLTPVHGTTGCGIFQRLSATGGAEKGMPSKTPIPLDAKPSTRPPLTVAEVTWAAACPLIAKIAKIAPANRVSCLLITWDLPAAVMLSDRTSLTNFSSNVKLMFRVSSVPPRHNFAHAGDTPEAKLVRTAQPKPQAGQSW